MNEYQSAILHPYAILVGYQQFKSGGRFFPVPETIFNKDYTGANRFLSPNGYFGLIEFSDDEDISEYTEVYDKYYGTPIDLDPSYLDMVSNSKKLKVSLDLNGTVKTINSVSITQNSSANIEGDFDLYDSQSGSYNNSDNAWSSTLKRDRSSRASQLNLDLIYGAYKKNDGTFWEGELPYDTGINNHNPPVESKSYISPLLPQINFAVSQPFTNSQGSPSIDINTSFSHTSQDGGSASASFSSSASVLDPFSTRIRGLPWEMIIRVSVIVVTPTKIKAWLTIGGGMNDPFIVFSRSSDPKSLEVIGIGEGPYEKVGDITLNFLGVDITAFIYKSNFFLYVNETVSSASFTGSFNITKEEDY